MPRRLWAVFAVIAAVTGCGGSQAGDPALRGITSVLLERHGKVVIERYYQGTRPSDRLPIFSITKSVTSALVGMAIADGRLSGVDERLPWRRQVTVGQLLSMTAGYARSVSFKRTDPESLADRPLLNRPGTFAYDSGSMDLLADLIARATGMPAAAYARRRLFGPMGITAERWPGSRGSSGLLLRPRDLLAFGQLYLDGGVWHGSASSRRAGSECRRARTLSSAADCTTGSAGGSGRARMPATAISDRCWRCSRGATRSCWSHRRARTLTRSRSCAGLRAADYFPLPCPLSGFCLSGLLP